MYSAVIRQTIFEEDCSRALQSIDQCADKFQQVLIVTKNKGAAVPKSYKGDQQIIVVPALKDTDITAKIVLEIPPTCSFNNSVLERIRVEVDTSPPQRMVFAVQSVQVYKPAPQHMWFYGFVLVSIVWDWFHSLYERNKTYYNTDIIVRCVVQKGTQKFVAKPTHSGRVMKRLFNYAAAPRIYSEYCVVKPPVSNYETVLGHLYKHKYYGFGGWLLLFAFYWGSLLTGVVFPVMGGGVPLVITLGLLFGQAFCVMLLTNSYVEMPIRFLLCLLYPLYYLAFPAVLLVAKLYRPKKSWK